MKKSLRILLIILAVLYAAALIILLFFKGNRGMLSGATMAEYVDALCNFVPFATITRYLRALARHTVSVMTVVKNLAGNFVLFMPFAFFVYVFTKMKLRSFFFLTFFSVLTAETLQLLTRTGSFDVDDIILNVAGAVLVYGILILIGRKPKEE